MTLLSPHNTKLMITIRAVVFTVNVITRCQCGNVLTVSKKTRDGWKLTQRMKKNDFGRTTALERYGSCIQRTLPFAFSEQTCGLWDKQRVAKTPAVHAQTANTNRSLRSIPPFPLCQSHFTPRTVSPSAPVLLRTIQTIESESSHFDNFSAISLTPSSTY